MKIIVNLFGGPGSGKSTTAAGVFTLLKLHGITCELVTEFAKDLTWEDRSKTLGNQFYVSGKQQHRLWRIPNTVDVVITDSPLLLGTLYSNDDMLNDLIVKKFSEFNNLNFYLNRVKPYNTIGRSQGESAAKELDVVTKQMLKKYEVSHTITNGDYTGINDIAHIIIYALTGDHKCEYVIDK